MPSSIWQFCLQFKIEQDPIRHTDTLSRAVDKRLVSSMRILYPCAYITKLTTSDMAFETFAFCSSLPYKKLLPNIQARVSWYFSNTPSNSASRHVIPIQDLLFFLNFHLGLGETWIIRWTFNVYENQPKWTEGSLPSCMWRSQVKTIRRCAIYMQINPTALQFTDTTTAETLKFINTSHL